MHDMISSVDSQNGAELNPLGIKGLSKRHLLLHCCCAPCATVVIEKLLPEYEITLFFYNPNIEPYEEYLIRKNELVRLAEMYSLHSCGDDDQEVQKIKILDIDYNNRIFTNTVNSLREEPEGGLRCAVCFDIRLSETAKQAKVLKFDIFATTLTVSPHKNAAIVNDSGITQSREHNITFLVKDFKKDNGYKRSVELSKKYGLYRQNYCGCSFSKR